MHCNGNFLLIKRILLMTESLALPFVSLLAVNSRLVENVHERYSYIPCILRQKQKNEPNRNGIKTIVHDKVHNQSIKPALFF